MSKLFTVIGCKSCPNRKTVSTKGFGYAVDWVCAATNNKLLAGYIEWASEERKDGDFPEWCPLPSAH